MKTSGYHYLESGLHKVIGLRLVERKPRLTRAESRFLRKELGLSQAKLGKFWGYDAQTVAIWEKRNRVPMIADRFIRAYYLEVEKGNAQIRAMIERLNEIDRQEDARLIFEETRQGWQAKAG